LNYAQNLEIQVSSLKNSYENSKKMMENEPYEAHEDLEKYRYKREQMQAKIQGHRTFQK